MGGELVLSGSRAPFDPPYPYPSHSADDNFGCPQDPTSTVPDLFLQRQAVIELSCDPTIIGYIAGLSASETSTCRYLVTGRTAAACGVLWSPAVVSRAP